MKDLTSIESPHGENVEAKITGYVKIEYTLNWLTPPKCTVRAINNCILFWVTSGISSQFFNGPLIQILCDIYLDTLKLCCWRLEYKLTQEEKPSDSIQSIPKAEF